MGCLALFVQAVNQLAKDNILRLQFAESVNISVHP